MAVLDNRTAFQGEMLPTQDADGRFLLVVVVKATYLFDPDGGLAVAPVQDPVNVCDEYEGASGASSIRLASDVAVYKPATDIALVGSAHAPDGTAVRRMTVELSVGPIRKRLLVFGDRVWDRGLSVSDPKPFSTMPLVYERAFGGGSEERRDERNPVGVGFYPNRPAVGAPLPNIEDPAHPMSSWSDRPAPEGFGFLAGDWQPRKSFIGTYDDHWKEEQFPLPPRDFDQRYFLAAHPDLRCTPHLRGDEAIEATGVTPDGVLRGSLPGSVVALSVQFRTGKPLRRLAVLDTVTLLTDSRKLNLVWRYPIQCPTKILDVESVTAFSLRLSTVDRIVRLSGS